MFTSAVRTINQVEEIRIGWRRIASSLGVSERTARSCVKLMERDKVISRLPRRGRYTVCADYGALMTWWDERKSRISAGYVLLKRKRKS